MMRAIMSHPMVVRARHLAGVLADRTLVQLNRRPKRVAVAFSLTLHLLAILLFLIHPPRGFSGGGDNGVGVAGGNGVGVSLVGIEDFDRMAMTAKSEPEEAEEITPLELDTAPETLTLTKVAPLPQLISDSLPDAVPNALKDQALAQSASGAPGTGNSGQNGTSGDDLWNAIAPCWRRVADPNTLAVTLQMSFDASGRLSVPPTIERDPSKPLNTQAMQSEAQALAALSQCGAYAMAAGRANVRVNFPKPY